MVRFNLVVIRVTNATQVEVKDPVLLNLVVHRGSSIVVVPSLAVAIVVPLEMLGQLPMPSRKLWPRRVFVMAAVAGSREEAHGVGSERRKSLPRP